MQKALFPGYTVGSDAYEDIVNICPAYGKGAAIIGGKHALAAAEDKIRQAVEAPASRSSAPSGMAAKPPGRTWTCSAPGGGGRHDLRRRRRQGHRYLQGSLPRNEPSLLHLPHHRLHLRRLHQPWHCLSSGRQPAEYSFSKIPPNHIFINTEIIANAPVRYLWAGMGDTMAKHYECTISSRNDIPAHSDAMGIALSSMCAGSSSAGAGRPWRIAAGTALPRS